MKQTFTALLAVIALLLIHGGLDKYQRVLDDRIAYAQWVDDACLPWHEGQRAIARVADGKLDCTLYDNVGYGRAVITVSAATMEIPE